MSNPPTVLEIPSDILDATAQFPTNFGFKVRPGPTFLEYRKDLSGYIFGLLCLGVIPIMIGIGIIISGGWAGSFFFIPAIISLIFIFKIAKTNLLKFVIDLAAESIYAGDKDIPFSQINSILLLKDYLRPKDNLHGIALNYKTDYGQVYNTLIMRTWTNNLESWQILGPYFAKYLSLFLHRDILFNNVPLETKTGEECLVILKKGKKTFVSWG